MWNGFKPVSKATGLRSPGKSHFIHIGSFFQFSSLFFFFFFHLWIPGTFSKRLLPPFFLLPSFVSPHQHLLFRPLRFLFRLIFLFLRMTTKVVNWRVFFFFVFYIEELKIWLELSCLLRLVVWSLILVDVWFPDRILLLLFVVTSSIHDVTTFLNIHSCFQLLLGIVFIS